MEDGRLSEQDNEVIGIAVDGVRRKLKEGKLSLDASVVGASLDEIVLEEIKVRQITDPVPPQYCTLLSARAYDDIQREFPSLCRDGYEPKKKGKTAMDRYLKARQEKEEDSS